MCSSPHPDPLPKGEGTPIPHLPQGEVIPIHPLPPGEGGPIPPLPLGEGGGEGWNDSTSQGRSRPSLLLRIAAAPLLAASFLTVAPVPLPGSIAALGSMGRAVAFFPLVGAAIGICLAALDRLLSLALPSSVVAALLLAALLAVTGALHLDALMDSFDGLFGGKDPAGRLAIMRDSRVGSYGIAAAGSLLLVEYGCLASLPVGVRPMALILALCLSRWAMAFVLWALPAASSSGLAAGLKPQLRWPHVAVGSATALLVAVATFGGVGAGAMAAAGLVALLGGRFAVARLGGVNGDLCGGLGQLVEAATLVITVAVSAAV